MLTKGPAKKVTIFLNEDTRHHMTALHDAIMTFLLHKGVTGATATRAYSGFGSHQVLHTPKVEVLAQHTSEKVEESRSRSSRAKRAGRSCSAYFSVRRTNGTASRCTRPW